MTQNQERERLKNSLLEKGVPLHERAHQGDKNATREAFEIFKVAHQLDPDDPTIAAYFGSCLALVARDLVDPNEKIRSALRGIKLLDRAAELDPENITVRTLRAFVNYRVPERYFNRTPVAVREFTYLAERYEQDPSVFSRGFYWEVLYHLGKAERNLESEERALATWQKLLAQNPGPRFLRLLRAEGLDVGPLADDELALAEKERILAEGVALHNKALAGGPELAEEAMRFFERAVADYPDDPLLQAYYGSCISLVGRHAADSNTMFAHAIKAMPIIDGAVKRAPDDLRVRLVRAEHSLRLPEPFFRRTAVAIVDLEYVRDHYDESRADLSREEFLGALWALGGAYWRLGIKEDAEATWEALLSQDSAGTYSARVRERLETLRADVFPVAVDPTDKDALLAEGIRLHDLGVRGNKSAVPAALELLEQALELASDDPLVRAYYGSAVALSGRDAPDTSTMFGKVIQGMIHLNFAVKAAPESVPVRRLRGYLCFHLPEALFHLTETAIEDLEFVRAAYERDGAATYGGRLDQLVHDLAEAYRRLGRHGEAEALMKGVE